MSWLKRLKEAKEREQGEAKEDSAASPCKKSDDELTIIYGHNLLSLHARNVKLEGGDTGRIRLTICEGDEKIIDNERCNWKLQGNGDIHVETNGTTYKFVSPNILRRVYVEAKD